MERFQGIALKIRRPKKKKLAATAGEREVVFRHGD
jgi:hypothetical protein